MQTVILSKNRVNIRVTRRQNRYLKNKHGK